MTCAAKDQADAVAVFRLVHEVSRDHDGHAFFDEAVDVRPEFAPRQRVDAGGGLVQEQHRRLVHDRAGQRQPLLEAQRQLVRRWFRRIGLQARRLDHLVAGILPPVALQPVDAGEKFQVLVHA